MVSREERGGVKEGGGMLKFLWLFPLPYFW